MFPQRVRLRRGLFQQFNQPLFFRLGSSQHGFEGFVVLAQLEQLLRVRDLVGAGDSKAVFGLLELGLDRSPLVEGRDGGDVGQVEIRFDCGQLCIEI